MDVVRSSGGKKRRIGATVDLAVLGNHRAARAGEWRALVEWRAWAGPLGQGALEERSVRDAKRIWIVRRYRIRFHIVTTANAISRARRDLAIAPWGPVAKQS